MRREVARAPLYLLLLGLLAACGSTLESNLATVSEEPLGTLESALCAGTSVSTLSISDISTHQGLMAGNGPWAVSIGANAVRLEYYVDGSLANWEERCAANSAGHCTGSGSWFFSKGNVACGSRTFLLKAWPMIIDSAGNRTTCTNNLRTVSQVVTEECPSFCGNWTCEAGENSWNCPQDCCEGSFCSDGSCCPSNGICSDGLYCPL